ncbi:fruit body lectin [Pseudovirgaria hyperparasitica]|uniref:Fruit body lectin n=1 Tax=Pseudovirgaria hyperparasitica TaxID=470096 RepID=A0A6A6W9T2_9PEZI|nr:fruit body lectin [Pseudovirgaria hyperparasitica]KAF2758636.1 fruit body lectin [Pseudovirgaria hyperparasitica]
MSYTIKVRVNQSSERFRLVESGVWYYANGGTWTVESNEQLTLTMGGSGTSGMVRYMTEAGKEAFFVAMGVHNYKPWVDIVTGLGDDITCVKALPEYYDGSSQRSKSREEQKTSESILNAQSRTIAAEFTSASGQNLELAINIG